MRTTSVRLAAALAVVAAAAAVALNCNGRRAPGRFTQRLVILGFDGMDPRLVQKWMDEGKLPNMQKLAKRGSGVQPLATAISTAGGVGFAELDSRFMLRRRPGVFVAGEMLDWEAPTGGYLLQASFATGAAAARGALAWLATRPT